MRRSTAAVRSAPAKDHRQDPLQLDVRPLPPEARPSAIFQVVGGLAAGESLVLINDHDPRPLRHRFDAEDRERFAWEYMQEGPEVWRVRITRS